jgi:hypothetical protein
MLRAWAVRPQMTPRTLQSLTADCPHHSTCGPGSTQSVCAGALGLAVSSPRMAWISSATKGMFCRISFHANHHAVSGRAREIYRSQRARRGREARGHTERHVGKHEDEGGQDDEGIL